MMTVPLPRASSTIPIITRSKVPPSQTSTTPWLGYRNEGVTAFRLPSRHFDCMVTVITVRDVPDGVRDELAARAAHAGKSLQEYLRRMFIDTAARPPSQM